VATVLLLHVNLQLQCRQAHRTYLTFKTFRIIDKLTVSMSIALMALAMNVIFVKPYRLVFSCRVIMTGFKPAPIPTRNAGFTLVALTDKPVKILGGQLQQLTPTVAF
jgi:hypothetical protein